MASRPYVPARGPTESKRATEPEGSSVTTSNRATRQSGHELQELQGTDNARSQQQPQGPGARAPAMTPGSRVGINRRRRGT